MNCDYLDKEQIINILNDTLECIDKQRKEIERLCNALNDIIERNSKAIEYINRTQMGEGYKKMLLEILKGSDKE